MRRTAISGTNITVGFDDGDDYPISIEVLCDDAAMRIYVTDDEARDLAAVLVELAS
jgi:hypothetical protein